MKKSNDRLSAILNGLTAFIWSLVLIGDIVTGIEHIPLLVIRVIVEVLALCSFFLSLYRYRKHR